MSIRYAIANRLTTTLWTSIGIAIVFAAASLFAVRLAAKRVGLRKLAR